MMRKKRTHVIVKSRHPQIRWAAAAGLILGLCAVGWGLFEYGRSRAGFDGIEADRRQAALLSRINGLEENNRQLSSQIAIVTQAREIDRHAYGEVDHTLTQLQDEVLELRQEVEFYRGIVNPPNDVRGLRIQSFRVQQDGETQTYRYRLILTQYGTTNRQIEGVTKMAVLGMQNGTQVELSPQDVAATDTPFRFRYFQELKGSLTLPDGFVPVRVTLQAIPRSKGGGAPVERTFSWAELIS